MLSAFAATILAPPQRNIKQTARSVLLAFQEGFVSVIKPRVSGMREKVIGAGCDWAQGAGIDTSGHKMIPNFGKPAGFDCIVYRRQ